MEEYIKKLENEVKWLTRREQYIRNSLSLLIEMVEDLLVDETVATCPSFNEILNDMKTRDLRQPWQVKIQQPPIKGGRNVKVSIKSKPKKPEKSSVSKRTKKAMKKLKANKRIFTGSIYGWNAKKDGTLVPNWKEQNNIDCMKSMLAGGQSANSVAKYMNTLGIKGKRGGRWSSSSVLRITRYKFHAARKNFPEPKWFTTSMKKGSRFKP